MYIVNFGRNIKMKISKSIIITVVYAAFEHVSSFPVIDRVNNKLFTTS